MLIIDKKHKDYYDGVVGTVGIDKTIVYERNIEKINDNSRFPKEFKIWRDKNPFISICNLRIDHNKTKKYEDVNGFIIGFCGKLYAGWKLIYKEKEWNNEKRYFDEISKYDIIYGINEAKKYLTSYFWTGKKGFKNIDDNMNYINNYDSIQIFREINAPIFVYDETIEKKIYFIINPILKEYEFYKVIDTFTAFQEISMFLGGVLGIGEKEIIEVEDKYKITQHGFDKWSFRKEPKKK